MAQDFLGQPIVEVLVEQEGQRVIDPVILDLLQTRTGQPLSMVDVRTTFDHLFNLGRFDDIQTTAEPVAGGVRVRYVLMPAHPIDRVEFRGNVSVSETELRRVVTDRFGRSPNPARAAEAAVALQNEYRRLGFPSARIAARVDPTHDPHRATLVFDIDPGRRARIADVQFLRIDPDAAKATFALPDIRTGEPYDAEKVQHTLERWEERMRAQGFYQARASVAALMPDDAYLRVSIGRGPLVVVAFSGDPLPAKERDRLVRIRAEGSADEDLLEDAKLAIEQYLRARGYRDATAEYSRDETTPGQLKITFHITRGPHYTVDTVRLTGNSAISTPELQKILTVAHGSEFVGAALEAQAAAVQAEYRTRGFTNAGVKANAGVLPTDSPDVPERRVEVTVAIDEGPRTTVRAITFTGQTVFTEGALRGTIPISVGERYLASEVIEGRDLIAIRYRNQGYLDVAVQNAVAFADKGTQADVSYTIEEGPHAIIEHIIVQGNDKTKKETILNELEIREGEPLGQAALDNSRTKLLRLGLFRRIEMVPVQHPGESRRDVLISVQEADRTTLGVGGGFEAALRARPTGPGGTAEDHFEMAPLGSFEIGRRNLWGSNRSVNLFTRVSLRATDILNPIGAPEETQSNLGFNEYRVIGNFIQPRLFARSEMLVTGIVEQAVRTTFNFSRRIARAEVSTRVTQPLSVAGRYSFEKTKLFDEIFAPDEKPVLIDKLFPEVRLSKVAGSLIFDTRDDLLNPAHGTLATLDADLAARALGSEVGFIRTFAQGFLYRKLPPSRPLVVALGARVGAARGFERLKDGLAVKELPASERFFAGGDTTVRGFSLDRLGTEDTISATGFPLGGNGVVIFNVELRAKVVGDLQGVGFIDAGNVFRLASELSFIDLRPAAGFGVRYLTPFGPLRMDLGFNLNPEQFGDLPRERRTLFFISLGQAF